MICQAGCMVDTYRMCQERAHEHSAGKDMTSSSYIKINNYVKAKANDHVY